MALDLDSTGTADLPPLVPSGTGAGALSQLGAPPPPAAGGGASGPAASPFSAPAPPEPPEVKFLTELARMPNAAMHERIKDDAELLSRLARQVIDGYRRDLASRSEWEDIAERAMAAAEQVREGKNYPFPNAANVRYPLIAIGALQFNARAYPAICPGRDVVKVKIGGNDPQGLKANRAARVAQYMSHQITDEMPAWESDMDRMLIQEPILGVGFKKTYWNMETNKPESELISGFDLVVSEKTGCLEKCPRTSHRLEYYPYEIEEKERAKIWLQSDLLATETSEDDQEPIEFIEQHCYFDLDGDDYAEPWIVTVSLQHETLVRITAGFDPLDVVHDGRTIVRVPRDDYFSAFNFLPNPKGGFYGIGFGHLLDSFSEVINTSFNQMLDAGSLQNAGGGFFGSGLDLQSDSDEFRMEPGKWYNTTTEAGDLKNNIVAMENPGPSLVLLQLLKMMMDDAKTMVGVQDILTGGASAQTMAPTTMMALVDQGLKVFTAIYKRIFNGLSREFKRLYNLNRKHLDQETYANYLGDPAADVKADFADDGCLVTPIADPNSVTMAMKMAMAAFLEQLAQNPLFQGKLNVPEILQRILEAAAIENPQKLIVPPQPPTPIDQLNVQKLQEEIESLKAAAQHNYALADAEGARGENYRARTAETIMNHQPDFTTNPTSP